MPMLDHVTWAAIGGYIAGFGSAVLLYAILLRRK